MINIIIESKYGDIYNNIYNLIDNESKNIDSEIDKVHTVPIDKARNKKLNITYEYKDKYQIQINISINGSIDIVAPYEIKKDVEDFIIDSYPEYKKLIGEDYEQKNYKRKIYRSNK